MAIALTELPETELIVRGKFPDRDEGAFDRESAKLLTAAAAVVESQVGVNNSSGYTAEEFFGQTGSMMGNTLTAHHQTLSKDNENLTAAAEWMSLAAQNVRTTKTAINDVVERYHDDYAAKVTEADEGAYPQSELREAKDQLVKAAQGEVDSLWSTYESRHGGIRAGIVARTSPPASLAEIKE